ncbi:hypothetical protein ABGB18_38865 [Nonomuraea sp. B12E4]|uniref:alpha/beta hydrolase n=1 Tax=Nonomuraea sp. B12E4 TaxID=3153564 RepID=UPI00325EB359
MSYEWPLDPHDLFAERYPQMLGLGLPAADIDAVRAAVTDMWADTPGGWAYEWSRLAGRYAGEGRHDLAVPAYGNAKFPTLANQPMRRALAHQAEQYQRAAPTFPRTRILAFDLAGTGETSHVPMTHDGGTEIIDGLIAHARTIGNGQVAHFGLSMGGHYSATTGLTGSVDAAVDLGGPVEAAFTAGRSFAHGMEGIVGNALGYDAIPTPGQVAAQLSTFTLRPLFDRDANAPMLVINGADDVHVPRHDTLVFQGRRDTRVELIPGTGHCAVTKLAQVMPIIYDWLTRTLKV